LIFSELQEPGKQERNRPSGTVWCESPIMETDSLNMKKAWMKISDEKE